MTKRRSHAFAVGDTVRYKPGTGTYGYEDMLDVDGRVEATVVGHTRTRVRITMPSDHGEITRAVDADSLQPVTGAPTHV